LPGSHPTAARAWRARAADPALVRRLCATLGLQPVVAAALAQRGVTGEDEARAYLEPSVDHLLDPLLLADMDKAATRIARAVKDGEEILVYGDYDVDGLSSTALMMQFLRYLGCKPHVYVPNRAFEGYSFTEGGVAHVLKTGARVVVSVDNGIVSMAPVAELAAAGVDVIITDHHLPGGELPPAFAVVNPRRHDCTYPFKSLAGVGVAFKVACAVANRLSEGKRRSPEMMRFLGEAMAWVALGTLSDMVPLQGENRILAARGLRAIPVSTSPGLAALCAVAEVRPENFSAEDVAFRLAPRLNAAGRLGRADISLALLIAVDAATARPLAEQLDRLNNQRRQMDRELLSSLQALLPDQPVDEPVVLHDDRWPAGLLGVAASRIAQQHGRPAVLISGKNGEPCKGSCRSVPGFDAQAALAECSAHLQEHGGHAMAAGFSVRGADVPAFRRAFADVWRRHVDRPSATAAIDYDGELPLAAVSSALVEQIERLAPFGEGNPRPVLGAMGVTLLEARRMGGDGTHLQAQLGQGPTSLRAVAFGRGDLADGLPRGAVADVLFTPKLNRYRGRANVELELVDLRLATRLPHLAAQPPAERAADPPRELGADGAA
jgi:single-stranded-DNA-specific exonuclease